MGFRPDDGKCERDAGNAAPCGAEVAGFQLFEIWRTRRVIGGDEIDGAVAQGLPKGLTIFATAARWRAFVERRAV